MLTEAIAAPPEHSPRLDASFAAIQLGDYLPMREIQSLFDDVPLDPYVLDGFRYKSITRVRVQDGRVLRAPHGPLFQPKEYNPVHGDLVRRYEEMDQNLTNLLAPMIRIFSACGSLSGWHEILVQAQRITASSGDDGITGFPVVEGWHRDNTSVLGIFLVNRVNISGGISMLARDREGMKLAFARTLDVGDLLLVDDTSLWHNTTPISRLESHGLAYRDVVILTWPSCREPTVSGHFSVR